RDHRLVGKRRYKFDLLIRERLHPVASQIDGAERGALPQQRDREDGAVAPLSSDGATFREHLRLALEVRYVDCPSLQHAAATDGPGNGGGHKPKPPTKRAIVGGCCQAVALKAEDRYVLGTAEYRRGLDQGVEHRL